MKDRQEYDRFYRETQLAGTFENKIKRLLALAAHRAKKKGVEFSITAADFNPITHCPLLGLPINFSKRGRGTADNSPTIDRIDPSQGYVPGNVWVISSKANRMKSDATAEELMALVLNLKKKMQSL